MGFFAAAAQLGPMLARTLPSAEGQLRRRRRGFPSTWRTTAEHVELRGTVLVIYKSKGGGLRSLSSSKSSRRVALHDIAGTGAIRANDAATRKGFYPFSIDVPGGTLTLHLAASNSDARANWLKELNRARVVFTHNDLTILSTIGEGHFGKVVLAQRKGCTGRDGLLALKEIQLTPGMQLHTALTERVLLASLPLHPFVITLQLAFRYDNYLYYGFDFMPGADMFELIRRKDMRMNLPIARFYISQVASALSHLHAHNIVYRDLKPENVLVDKVGNLCLADMGLAKRLPRDGLTYTVCGTRDYLAPEMIEEGRSNVRIGYGLSIDFWQLGCMVYELYAGHSPFWSASHGDCRDDTARPGSGATAARILGGDFKRPRGMEPAAWSLAQALLSQSPAERLGTIASGPRRPSSDVTTVGGGWGDVRAHAFFEGVDWDAVLRKSVRPPYKPLSTRKSLVANFNAQITARPAWWGAEDEAAARQHRWEQLFTEELRGFAFVRAQPPPQAEPKQAEIAPFE
ncbi:kinase-like domain-containing protein [Tribonema minus]|uniref:Kinase-like domain-containing protein n=1 Tax=Tribonema minus TaxID=303371 RepID=A0A836CNX9_9STRA|nr:kinase-like domain-containing protein [Tribonema minus]